MRRTDHRAKRQLEIEDLTKPKAKKTKKKTAAKAKKVKQPKPAPKPLFDPNKPYATCGFGLNTYWMQNGVYYDPSTKKVVKPVKKPVPATQTKLADKNEKMTNEKAVELLRQKAKILEAHAAKEYKRVLRNQSQRQKQMAILGPSLIELTNVLDFFDDDYPHIVGSARALYNKLEKCSDKIVRLIRHKETNIAREKRTDFAAYCYELSQILNLIADKSEHDKSTPEPAVETLSPERAGDLGRGEVANGQTTETHEQKVKLQWSKIMSKQEIATALGLPGVYKLNKLCEAKVYEVKQVAGMRESWQIRIDKLDDSLQKKLLPRA